MPKGKLDQHLTASQLADVFTAAWETGQTSTWLIVLDDFGGYLVPALQRLAKLNPTFRVDPLDDK
jgi:hypothetical protein